MVIGVVLINLVLNFVGFGVLYVFGFVKSVIGSFVLGFYFVVVIELMVVVLVVIVIV